MRLTLGFLLLALVAVSVGCTSDREPTITGSARDLNALTEAESRWDANEPAAYRYVIRRNCLACTPAVAGESALVEVDESGVTRTTPVEEGSAPSDLTVASAFAWLGREILRDFYFEREISYDPIYGFPSHARIQDTYGHGWTISITEFEVLENG
jgi:hypothetical protein